MFSTVNPLRVTTYCERVVFRRSAVERAVDRANRRYVAHAGGYVAKVGRRSIKRKGAARSEPKRFTASGTERAAWRRRQAEIMTQPASPVGQPPYTHTQHAVSLRKVIKYGVDRQGPSAVAGPAAYASRETREIWRLHEFGGTRRLYVFRIGGRVFTHSKSRVGRLSSTERITAHYPKRPTMQPALEKAEPKLPEFWRNAVRK
jgi:hypothetical protein